MITLYRTYFKKMKKILITIFLSVMALGLSAQNRNWDFNWDSSLNLLGSTGKTLPFWQRTGQNGILPIGSSALLTAGADVAYKADNGLFFEAGANLAGAAQVKTPYSEAGFTGLVDRLYVSGGWRMLRLDLGMIERKKELSDLSLTGGNIMITGNARNIPGLNFHTDWIYFEKGHWVGVRGNFAHYQMVDNRYVKNTLLHNKSAEIKFALGKKVDFMGGLDHWAQWGGESPRYGKQPSTIKDYVRIIMAKGGGADATVSDQVNVLGNHLGRAFVRVNWRAKDFTFTFQYDKPFEDGTSSRLQNFPDGVWTVQFVMPDKNAWVSEVLYELVTTTWQSGPAHDRPATEEEKAEQDPNDFYYGKVVLGGCDNYFSNGEYASGWTYYGRTIGLPLIIPNAPGADGMTGHMASSRVRGHHLGLKGAIAHKLPYAFKSTYHRSWGKYHQGDKSFFASKPWQLSLALDFGFSQFLPKNLPMGLSAGLYADFGQLYQNSAGLTLRINTSNK
jgi:hypothetical protein